MTTKEKILQSALELFAVQGIRATALSQIAREVGIAKPSIYNHFASKDVIIEEMYQYYRSQAVNNNDFTIQDLEKFIIDHDAEEILKRVVASYENMYAEKNTVLFWTLIHSEKLHDETAFQIVCEETEKMIGKTRWLLEKMVSCGKMSKENLDGKVICFAYAIESLQIEKLMNKRHGKSNQIIDERIEKLVHSIASVF